MTSQVVAMSHRMMGDRERKNDTNIHMKQKEVVQSLTHCPLLLSGHILSTVVSTYYMCLIYPYVGV